MLKTMAAAGAVGAAAGAGGLIVNAAKQIIMPEPVSAATFWKGADVSWLPEMEAKGYKFFNTDGAEEDCLSILKGYGVNAIRLRTWVNPSNDPVNGNCNQAQTIAMAVRCKNAGLPVDIDFHFGDTWNSVGGQTPPAAWAKMDYSEMLNAMYSYVYNFMEVMKYNKVTPGWVQLGNEINSGICHPIGELSNASQMTGLLNAAHDMVKEVFPSTPTIIHLAQPQKSSGVTDMLNAYVANGGKWDITGFSSYGSGSEVAPIVANMAGFQKQYGKPVMQVEFGGNSNNPSGTAASMKGYIDGVRNFGGLGVFYWEPEVYAPFDTYAAGAWNTNGKPIAQILDAYNS
jgi:arabinogalactan endo-1,4-beta-galactosidase